MTPRSEPSALFKVWVQPGASRQRIIGMHSDALKVAVTAPAEKGRANKALEKMLAREIGIPASAVSVVAGKASRQKLVRIVGVDQEQLNAWLSAAGA